MVMVNKVLAILGSVRFWIVTLTAALAILQGQDPSTVAQVWLAAIAAIGTIDKAAEKIGG